MGSMVQSAMFDCGMRSCNPLGSSCIILPPSCSPAQGQTEVRLCWWKLRSICALLNLSVFFFLGWIQESLGRKQATWEMSSCGWSLCRCPLRESLDSPGVVLSRQPGHEDMDSARRLWLFFLLKPEELNPGHDAVNVRVSGVSLYLLHWYYLLLHLCFFPFSINQTSSKYT